MKPFTIYSKDLVLSVNIIKATFGYKKDYLTVLKTGAITFEFIPMYYDNENKRGLNLQARKVFALSPSNAGIVVGVTDQKLETSFEMDCNYVAGTDELRDEKKMTISKKEKDDKVTIKFTVKLHSTQLF